MHIHDSMDHYFNHILFLEISSLYHIPTIYTYQSHKLSINLSLNSLINPWITHNEKFYPL